MPSPSSGRPDLPPPQVRIVLVHSPLLDRDTWEPVAEALRQRHCQVVLPRLADLGRPPFWPEHVASVAEAIGDPDPDGSPLVLVLHSGAGQLADHLVADLDRRGHTVEAAVFADAGLPTGGGSRLGQLRLESPATADALEARLQAGERFPDWTDVQLRPLVPDGARRRRLLDGVRNQPAEYWTEPIPGIPTPPHHRAVLLLSDAYEPTAAAADRGNWPMVDLGAGNHLLALREPDRVADAILVLVDRVLAMPGSGPPGHSR